MRAELYRPEDPEAVVAVATWRDGRAAIEPAEGAPEGLERIFRPVPVVVGDPGLRILGAHGETLLPPGSLYWFRMALLTRAEPLGLSVRFVPEVREGGWDPAGQYRTFDEQIDRLEGSSA